jgi:hypothetical protein
MPKLTTDRLVGYGVRFDEVQVPVVDPKDGELIRDARGEAKLEPMLRQTFQDPQTGHTVVVEWPLEVKQEIVRVLTGGIEVPSLVLPDAVRH